MRKIEFRAWDKYSKRFYPKQEMNTIGGFYYNGGQIDNNYILSQFIGVKDRNGTKIFEGDIVKQGRDKGIVIYEGTEFIAMGKMIDECCSNLLCNPEQIEVIGNIYQNPKLLR